MTFTFLGVIKKMLNISEPLTCLELFARSLIPNWVSVGREVLKFQKESIFTINS